jgi:hypothetical protein
MFLLQTEASSTLGDGMLIGSTLPATSPTDVVHDSDTLLGIYTQAELNAGHVLKTRAFDEDIRFRYYRLCQHQTGVPIQEPYVPPPSVLGNTQTYDSGADNFVTPNYTSTLIIELWGGAACGGVSTNASDGNDTTCTTYSLTAGKGHKASTAAANSATGAGTGGTPTGGNTANTNGGNGDPPSPASSAEGFSGKGGDSPNGGFGGDAVTNSGVALLQGNDGRAPGGGGSGRNVLTSIAGGTYFKYPGGGSGAYVKHVLIRGVAGSPNPGDLIAYSVGAGALSPIGDGDGANGRVKFTWD